MIECPTIASCNSCTINCGNSGCIESTLIGHSCSNMIVNSNDEKGCQDCQIYAPDSYGNLTVNSVGGRGNLRRASVHSSSHSGFINITCLGNDDIEWYVNYCLYYNIIYTCTYIQVV